tara:strand:- start:1398 stop:3959 length:2562 start_codon:yes stop_codon:yes gene_type:complete
MGLNKTRLIAGILGTNSLVSYDSDLTQSSYFKGPSSSATGTTSIYSSIDDLPVSAEAGTKALITSTNTLYLYNSGWYKIALINFSPQWVTQPNSSYNLAVDSTPTVITMLATDSDDVPIQYIATTDSNFDAIAIVSHDSDKHNVFTITPIDSENGAATGGTGTITFKASDGVNLVQQLSTFSLSFKISNSNYTSLLLAADTAGTDNQVDASSNNHTITEVGNVTSTSFAPHHPGGYSTYFDGVGDELNIQGVAGLAPGTGDFSISCWIKPVVLDNKDIASNISIVTQDRQYYRFMTRSDGSIWFGTRYQGGAHPSYWAKSATGLITAGKWHHVYAARIGGTLYTAVDGTKDVSVSNQSDGGLNMNKDDLIIGGWNYDGYANNNNIYIKDFKFNKGTVEFDISSASSYTVPTEQVTADASTQGLFCSSPTIIDASSNASSISIAGDPSTKRHSPYDYFKYTKADHGGSVYFDGTGDYITAPQAVSTSLAGQSYYTIEGWFYATDLTGGGMIAASGNGTQTSNIRVTDAGKLYFQIYFQSGNHTLFETPDANKVKLNQWHHIAFVHNYGEYAVPNEYIFYVDGKNVGSTTTAINSYGWYNGYAMGPLYIGKHSYNNSVYWTGYISDFRIVNSLVYDSEFTPPTAPLTPITNTQLLTCTNKNDIWDISSGSVVTKAGNVTASNTETKFATSSAMYFDGSGDYLSIADDIEFHPSGNFTAECWIYPTASPSQPLIFGQWSNPYSWAIQLSNNSSRNVRMIFHDGSFQDTVTSTAVALNTWTHLALVKNGSTATIYVNGVSAGTDTVGSLTNSTAPVTLGATSSGGQPFSGYIQDARFTNGLARYTSTFTPPTAEFTG